MNQALEQREFPPIDRERLLERLGFILPALLWLGDGGTSSLLLAAVVIGMAADRTEFYDELDIITPASHLARYQANRIALAKRSREGVAA